MSYRSPTSIQYLHRYFTVFFIKELKGWIKTIGFHGPQAALALLAVIGLVIYADPRPPSTVYIATGQEGSSYKTIAEKIQKIFATKNLQLELVPTAGLGDGLRGLNSDDSKVSASFLTVGVVSAENYPNLVSLGSVQYAPIWLFYRGEEVQTNDPFEYFSNKNISIGPAGNVTNKIYRLLHGLSTKNPFSENGISELPSKEAADQLIAGKIDAAFIVDNYESETIQKLLQAKNIHLMDFPLADAYVKKMPFLQKLVIPKGSIDLEGVSPKNNVNILSTTTSLLVEKNTHPAVQWGYLLAAKEIGSKNDTFFAPAGYFPRNLDSHFPLSPTAKRFYESGTPVFFTYLPLALASFLEQIWFYILAFIFIVSPILTKITGLRTTPSEALMFRLFTDLRALDEGILAAQTIEEVHRIQGVLADFERDVYQTWLFGKNARFHFTLKGNLNQVKQHAKEKLRELSQTTSH